MRISIAFTTLFAALSVLALPLAKRDSSNPSLSIRSSDVPVEDIFYSRALSAAVKAAKAAKAVTNKSAGLATQASKTKVQAQGDRKARKSQQTVKKAARVEKAKAKQKADPARYKTHEQKIKDKATVSFSPGASRRLDGMGLHGKDRKAAKKFHKNVVKSEMKKNGAKQGVVVATAHTGGTVKDEKNHITAQFKDNKNRPMPSTWKDSKTGEVKTGEKNQHHVYVGNKKQPSAWTNAVDASNKRKAAADSAKEAESSTARKAKVDAAKLAGESKKSEIGDDAEKKRAQREKVKAEKAARKKKT